MKNDNIHMLQYVAGTLYGITTMMDDAQPLKNVLASLSEEVSNVVISETIDRDEETEIGRVNIYMDDGDDGR